MAKQEAYAPISEPRPEYQAPEIRTLSEAEVLDKVGPAQAYTGNLPFSF